MQQTYSPVPGKTLTPGFGRTHLQRRRSDYTVGLRRTSSIMPVCKPLMSWLDVPRVTWAQEVPTCLHGAQIHFEPAGDLHGKAQGLKGWWAFWPCYRGCACCAWGLPTAPGEPAYAPGWGTEPWTKMKGTKKGVSSTPCSQLSAGQGRTPSLMCFLHISYMYRWWGLFLELSF